jgi:5-dehydro-2-deoxygluconokinase
VSGRPATEAEAAKVSEFKRVIYEGFLTSIKEGVPEEYAGILCDPQFGSTVLLDAKSRGITFAAPVEKSGQDVFDFENGADYAKQIEKIDPDFCKVLVRMNPEGNKEENDLQIGRLKELGDYLEQTKRGYLFELLVAATPAQLASVGGDNASFDSKLRPGLMVQAMAQLQEAGIEPDLWKIEGVDQPEDAIAIVKQAQTNGRKAGVITLGRGESKEKVKEWLTVGAKVPGVVGFAVGRTIFWEPLEGYYKGTLSRDQAVEQISRNYLELVELWQTARKQVG